MSRASVRTSNCLDPVKTVPAQSGEMMETVRLPCPALLGCGAKTAFGRKMCHRRKAKDKHHSLYGQGIGQRIIVPCPPRPVRGEQEANKRPLEKPKANLGGMASGRAACVRHSQAGIKPRYQLWWLKQANGQAKSAK